MSEVTRPGVADAITYTGGNIAAVADWVLARGGSCTSPMAVEFNHEDFIVQVGPKRMVHPLLPGDTLTWDGTTIRCDTCPEAGRANLGTLTAIAVVVAILIALVSVKAAGAQALDQPVSYDVGDVLVYATATRNPSCSVTRGLVNNGTVPLRVLGSAFTDDEPAHLAPNQGTFDGDQVIAPGERLTAQWTNSDYLPEGKVYLGWSVMLADGVDQIGATWLEAIPACEPDTSTTTPVTEPPATSTPTSTPTPTDPPPSTSVAPDPVEPTPTAPGPEATTTSLCTADCGTAGVADVDICTIGTDMGVCGIHVTRSELAATGATTGLLTAVGGTLVATGLVCLAFTPARRRLNALRKDGAR